MIDADALIADECRPVVDASAASAVSGVPEHIE